MRDFGHPALQARLAESDMASKVKSTDTLVAQFSSIGSMGGKENKKWSVGVCEHTDTDTGARTHTLALTCTYRYARRSIGSRA